MQRCDDCSSDQYPPRPICRRCASLALSYRPVSGDGEVLEVSDEVEIVDPFAVTGRPFVLAVVQLVEDERLVVPSKLLGVSTPLEVTLGSPVRADFERTTTGSTRLVFVLVPTAEDAETRPTSGAEGVRRALGPGATARAARRSGTTLGPGLTFRCSRVVDRRNATCGGSDGAGRRLRCPSLRSPVGIRDRPGRLPRRRLLSARSVCSCGRSVSTILAAPSDSDRRGGRSEPGGGAHAIVAQSVDDAYSPIVAALACVIRSTSSALDIPASAGAEERSTSSAIQLGPCGRCSIASATTCSGVFAPGNG